MHAFLKQGMPPEFSFGGVPIHETVRQSMKPGETNAQWMKWMVKGRFNLPTEDHPPHHVTKSAGSSKRKLTKVSAQNSRPIRPCFPPDCGCPPPPPCLLLPGAQAQRARRRALQRKQDLVTAKLWKEKPTYGAFEPPGRDASIEEQPIG